MALNEPSAAPGSPDASVAPSESWAHPDPLAPGPPRVFQSQMDQWAEDLMKNFPGPEAYLCFWLSTTKDKTEFADYLWSQFPEAEDTCYHHDSLLPPFKEADIGLTPATCFHIAALGYTRAASLKPPPGNAIYYEVTQQIKLDGFNSQVQPLLLNQPDELHHNGLKPPRSPSNMGSLALQPASLGYMKGMARVCTLLSHLHRCMKENVDLANVHPKLYESCLRIYGVFIPQESKMEESLKAMKISNQDSIRKPYNVIQIAGT